MSGSELEYALSLLETPYERYIQEGNARLAGAPFGAFGDVWSYCMPEERTTTGGTERTYWYDAKYFGTPTAPRDHDRGRRAEIQLQGQACCPARARPKPSISCSITRTAGRSPAPNSCRLSISTRCAHTRPALNASMRPSAGNVTLEIRRRGSTGVETEVVFKRDTPGAPMIRSDTGEPERRTAETLLAVAPIGSRVRWTNLAAVPKDRKKEREIGNPWQNENTIKLGPDKFGAHGTATGIFTAHNTHTREDVEVMTARGTNPDADASYVRRNIFISEIEFFRSPVEP